MYAVEVRDHIMIAHSLPGDVFGPAQRLHGATFVVDVAFFRETLDADNIVVDIGLALQVLRQTLEPLNYRNLDDLASFAGHKTTSEFMARHIFDAIAAAIRAGRLGAGAGGIDRVRVTLNESHVARAWYEAAIGA
jgi:6-pyruvoyl-tetrahydropterin synthase